MHESIRITHAQIISVNCPNYRHIQSNAKCRELQPLKRSMQFVRALRLSVSQGSEKTNIHRRQSIELKQSNSSTPVECKMADNTSRVHRRFLYSVNRNDSFQMIYMSNAIYTAWLWCSNFNHVPLLIQSRFVFSLVCSLLKMFFCSPSHQLSALE